MKNLVLFLLLFLSVGVFSEIQVLRNKHKPADKFSSEGCFVSKKGKKKVQQAPVGSSHSKNISIKETSNKQKPSVQRKPTSQEADPSLKEELVGEDYYYTVDSQVIQQEVTKHLRGIERLCNIEDSTEKIKEWNKRSQALTQLADQYVDERRLNAEDEYLLRSLRYYTSPGRLSYGQEITQELLNDINLYEEFKAQYYVDNQLNSETPLSELPDDWAQKIAKGLSCF